MRRLPNAVKACLPAASVQILESGDLIFFDTEGTREHSHSSTTLWAFYSATRREWMSISRSGGLHRGKKTKVEGKVALGIISNFVGAGTIVYFASHNRIDYNRLLDWYRQEGMFASAPSRWLNAGAELLFKVFGRKGEPMLSPNAEQATIYRYFWNLLQADALAVAFDNDVEKKAVLFPSNDCGKHIVRVYCMG